MSATMARQGGRVQLLQSDMCLALNVAIMAKGECSRATIEETHQLIKKPGAKVREEKNQGVEFPGKKKVKAVIERHPAMIRENQMDGCLSCQNGTEMYPQSRWRCKGMGVPLLPPPGPPWPKTPAVPPGDSERNHSTVIEGPPPGYVYIHTPLRNAQFFNHNAYAQYRKCDKDFIPDLLTDQRLSTC